MPSRWLSPLLVAILVLPPPTPAAAASGSPQERHRAAERAGELLERIVHRRERAAFRAAPDAGGGARPLAEDFELVAHLDLPGRSPHGDVLVHDHGRGAGTFAYVGTWSGACSATGVKIVDVNRPRRPELVALATVGDGVSLEDMQVARVGRRDVLGVGVQACGRGGRGGLALFDVTDPSRPRSLSFTRVPFPRFFGVHELDLVVREDGRALALLAVPFIEALVPLFGLDRGGDFRIVDITRPADPVPLADWGIIGDSSLPTPDGQEITTTFQGSGYFPAYYAHSVRGADGGTTAYVSYWDGGILKFDLSDPTSPVLVGRTVYPNGGGDDGDGHSVAVHDVGGERYLLQNDEDLEPLAPTGITSSATGGRVFWGIEEPWAVTRLTDTGAVAGTVADAGDGCEPTDLAGASGRVVLVDVIDPFYAGLIPGWPQPPCGVGGQVERAFEAGAAALVLNFVSPDDARPFPSRVPRAARDARGMPIVAVSDIDGLVDAIRARGGSATITLTPGEPSWGFVRVFREGAADADGDGVAEFHQVGSFSDLRYVTGAPDAPPGTWSVHNTEVWGDRAYSSWYSHGIVAIDLTDPSAPALVGRFRPEPSGEKAGVFGEERFAQVWGVAIDAERGLIFASDMRSGLWIVRPTGDAAPST